MRFSRHNTGAMLAIVAGLFSFALAIWPAPAPQGVLGDWTGLWTTGLLILALCCIGAPFLTNRSTALSKGLLAFAALALFGSGTFFWLFADSGFTTALWDYVPGILAAAAAVLIGPVDQPEVDRAMRAEGRNTGERSTRRRAA